MAEKSYSEKLAQYTSDLRIDRIPPNVIDSAKLHILDSIGCLLAGSRLEPGKLAYELVIKLDGGGGSGSPLLGTDQRVSYLDAVQAMATAAHCGELDDIHGGAGTCVGALVVPALLGLAEKHPVSGETFIEAAVAGYETIVRVGLSIDAPKLFERGGWWPSTVCGALGVAAAGAKLLGWPVEQATNALGIASLFAGGLLTGGNEGATARHLAFGRAAQSGAFALLAAEQVLTGPKFAFEDPRGFWATLCAEPRSVFFQSFEQFYLPEVAFKPYPCARQLHAAVEALLKVISSNSMTPDAIAAIEVAVPSANAAMVNRPATPKLRAATLGSAQYVIAVTALRGKIDLESFEDRFLRDPKVHQLMTKVTVSGDAELDRHFPKYWSGGVAVTLADGRKHAEQILAPKGERENPMTSREVEGKFLRLAAPVIGHDQALIVRDAVSSLDSRHGLDSLLAALRK